LGSALFSCQQKQEPITLHKVEGKTMGEFYHISYVGDEIHAVTEVASVADHGRRYGQVQWYRKLVNQRGEVVQDGMLCTIVKRRVTLSSKNLTIVEAAVSQVVPEPHANIAKETVVGSLSL
jgi:hypothetical protein